MADLRKSPSEIRALIQSRLAGMLPDVRVGQGLGWQGTGQSCLRIWQEEMDKVTRDDQGTPLP
jgi:hypothetical protein